MAVAVHPEPEVLVAARDLTKNIAAIRDKLAFVTDPRVLGELAIELVEATACLDGLRSEAVGLAAANATPQTVGVRTMGQFVGSETNRSPASTRRDQSAYRWLRTYPIFAEAYFSGQITDEHVAILKRLENARTVEKLRPAQQFLIDAAVDVESFRAFETVCEYWLVHVDPDGEEPRDQLESNAVRFRRGSGGRGKVVMDLDALSFRAFKTMVEHRATALREAASVKTTPLTAAQDRFASTMSLLVEGFARTDGTLPLPLINIVMSQTVAEWAQGQLTGDEPTESVPVDPFDVDGRCELIDGTPVHPLLVSAVSGLWQLASPLLRRYVLSGRGRVVDYSHNVRIHPEHLRTAAHIQHRGACATKGCDAPHDWLQMDHIEPASKGGPTSLPNTEPLCRPDNFAKGDRPGFGRVKRPTDDDPDDDHGKHGE